MGSSHTVTDSSNRSANKATATDSNNHKQHAVSAVMSKLASVEPVLISNGPCGSNCANGLTAIFVYVSLLMAQTSAITCFTELVNAPRIYL